MPCNESVITGDLTLDCSDVPIGGIVSAYVCRYADVTSFSEANGEVTDISITASKVVNLEFNPKDGFSKFTDTKTVDDTGAVTATPEVLLEFPKTTKEKRNALDKLAVPNAEYVVFIETAAGIKHALGLDFGLNASEVRGQSGASRTDKNKYELKFSGEEINLARTMTDSAWDKVIAAKKP